MPRISNLVFEGNISLTGLGQLVGARIQNVTSDGRLLLEGQLAELENSTGVSRAGNVVFDVEEQALFIYSGATQKYEPVSFDLEGDVSYQGPITPANADTADVVASKGFQYVVTQSGTLSKTGVTFQPSATVEVGDIVLFWNSSLAYVLQTNFGPATTEKRGHVEIASQEEFDSGVGNGIVTPAVFAGSTYRQQIDDNNSAHTANLSEISDLKIFTGSTTQLQTESLNIADAINELKQRADSASGEINSLELFIDPSVSLSTVEQTLSRAINELFDTDSDASDRSAAIESNVLSLQTSVGNVDSLETDDISTLVAAINELHGQINVLDSDYNLADDNTSAADTENINADNAINLNSFNIDALQFRVTNHESDLKYYEGVYADLQVQITANDNDILNLQNRRNTDSDEIFLLQTKMGIVEGRLNTLEGVDSDQDVRLSALEIEQGIQADRLTINETDIDTLQADIGVIGNLNTFDSNLVGAINEVHTELDGIDTRLTDEDFNITNLESAVGSGSLNTTSQDLVSAMNELKQGINNNDSDFGLVDRRIAFREQSPEIKAYNQQNITLPQDTAVRINHNLELPNPFAFTIGIMQQNGDLIEVEVDVVNSNSIDLTSYEDINDASIFILGLIDAVDITGNHPAGVDRVINGVIVPSNAVFMQGSTEEYVITQNGVIIVTNP